MGGKFLTLLLFVVFLSCQPKEKDLILKNINSIEELKEYFLQTKKIQRFSNTHLWVRDTVSDQVRRKFFNQEEIDDYKFLFRITSIKFYTDTTSTYFLYGLANKFDIVEQIRVRSYREEKLIEDLPAWQTDTYTDHFNYWFENQELVFLRGNTRGTNHKYFLLKDGQIVDNNIIPDSLFRRQDYIPELERKVRLLTDFSDKKVNVNSEKFSLTGRLMKYIGGGKGCDKFILVELDNSILNKFTHILIRPVINRMSSIYGLRNEKLIRKEQCDERVFWPADSIFEFQEQVYIEYQ